MLLARRLVPTGKARLRLMPPRRHETQLHHGFSRDVESNVHILATGLGGDAFTQTPLTVIAKRQDAGLLEPQQRAFELVGNKSQVGSNLVMALCAPRDAAEHFETNRVGEYTTHPAHRFTHSASVSSARSCA